ncbi:MAG: hypothetical protein RID91_09360 [Azospirillaceae bacterium]
MLFGVKPQAIQGLPSASGTTARAGDTGAATARTAARQGDGSQGPKPGPEANGGLTNRELLAQRDAHRARMDARQAEHEAKTRAFQEEHGFRQRATDSLRNTYHKARAGAFGADHFSSRAEAMEFALRMASGIRSAVRNVETAARVSSNEWQADVTQKLGAEETAQLTARYKDSGEAGRMEAYIYSARLEKSLEVSGETYTLDGEDSRLGAFTISWGGEKLVAVNEDRETFTYFDAAGNALTHDEWQETRVDIRA